MVTGRGAPQLTDLEGRRPLVADADVVAMGHRTLEPVADEVLATGMTLFDVAELRRGGQAEAALLRALTASELAVGAQLTIFDPDLDPAGRLAAELTTTVVAGLGLRAGVP